MIETARTQTPPAGAPVEWREGDAHALPCADATFDVVCCQQGLQFFPDKPHGLGEAPGGQPPEAARCPMHGLGKLKPSKQYPGYYCAGRLEDDSWCKHRWQAA